MWKCVEVWEFGCFVDCKRKSITSSPSLPHPRHIILASSKDYYFDFGGASPPDRPTDLP